MLEANRRRSGRKKITMVVILEERGDGNGEGEKG